MEDILQSNQSNIAMDRVDLRNYTLDMIDGIMGMAKSVEDDNLFVILSLTKRAVEGSCRDLAACA